MPFKVSTLFPDYIFEGKIELTPEIDAKVIGGANKSLDSAVAMETNYGAITNKEYPLDNQLKKLQMLIGDYFYKEVNKVLPLHERNLSVLNPYLISLKPGHIFPVNLDKERWYNCAIWLQHTKGGDLYFENFGTKLFATPNLLQGDNHVVKARKHKLVFWPSHIPWGLTVNQGRADHILFSCSFIAPMKPEYRKKITGKA
tara:strand:+ start:223 stop:822 length:600 start_codon:yes stop_codon:yes gene_type:complete